MIRTAWLQVADAAAVALAAGGVALLPWLEVPSTQQWLLVLVVSLAAPLGLALGGAYRSYRASSMADWLGPVAWAWIGLSLLILLSLWVLQLSEQFSRLWLGSWLVGSLLMLWLARASGYALLGALRRRGFNHKRLVIVGAGRLGQTLAARLADRPDAGFDLVAFFDDDPAKWQSGGLSVLPADELAEWLNREGADELWITLPLRAEARVRALLDQVQSTTLNIRYVPDLSGLRLINHAPREILGHAMLDLTVSPMTDPVNRVVKELEDRLGALVLLVLFAPVMLAVGLGVKLSSPGPVFYRQERVGLNGRLFTMLKFRSMPVDVERLGVHWGQAEDKVVSRFGAFIRRTSLDELPQLLNVLLGDMSLVGPRPERPQFVQAFKDQIPGYMQKHLVKAGITGWAQIHGWRGDTDLNTRIEYDLWYIEHWSVWLDVKILFLTLFRGLIHPNAR